MTVCSEWVNNQAILTLHDRIYIRLSLNQRLIRDNFPDLEVISSHNQTNKYMLKKEKPSVKNCLSFCTNLAKFLREKKHKNSAYFLYYIIHIHKSRNFKKIRIVYAWCFCNLKLHRHEVSTIHQYKNIKQFCNNYRLVKNNTTTNC